MLPAAAPVLVQVGHHPGDDVTGEAGLVPDDPVRRPDLAGIGPAVGVANSDQAGTPGRRDRGATAAWGEPPRGTGADRKGQGHGDGPLGALDRSSSVRDDAVHVVRVSADGVAQVGVVDVAGLLDQDRAQPGGLCVGRGDARVGESAVSSRS